MRIAYLLPFLMSSVTAVVVSADPVDIIRDLDLKFAYYYNTNNFDGVAELYHDDATLIPPTADSFIPTPALSGFFEETAEMGLTDLTLTPLTVVTDGDNVIHEVGNVTHSFQPEGGKVRQLWLSCDQISFNFNTPSLPETKLYPIDKT